MPDPYHTRAPLLPENVENPFAKAIKSEDKEIVVDADFVVLVAGAVPDDSFFYDCQSINAVPEFHKFLKPNWLPIK